MTCRLSMILLLLLQKAFTTDTVNGDGNRMAARMTLVMINDDDEGFGLLLSIVFIIVDNNVVGFNTGRK